MTYEKVSNHYSDAWFEKVDGESFGYILDLTSSLTLVNLFKLSFFFFPPALSFSTFSSFLSCKLETKGGGVFAVNRNPAVNRKSGERCLVVLGWLCDPFYSAATMHCHIGGVGTSSSHSVAETGKWGTSQEVKN